MSWNDPPEYSFLDAFDRIKKELEWKKAECADEIERLEEQLNCLHSMHTEQEQDLGGETNTSIYCLICGFVWY